MKKIILSVACIVIFYCAHSQSDYKRAIGGRLTSHFRYDAVALSYKNFITDNGAFEFNLGFGGRNIYVPNSGGKTSFSPGVSVSGSYQYHVDIFTPTDENLRWFAGGGLTMFNVMSKNNAYEGFGAGLFGTAGIDYTFKNSPVNLTADWRPTFFLAAPSAYPPLDIGTLGVAVRYTF